MNKILILSLMTINLLANDIPVDLVKKHKFARSIDVNAKIIQLSNAKQSVMSLLDGHIEKYFVKAGDKVVKNQPIALIDSISLSDMTSRYLSLKKQFISLNKNFKATKTLYKKGLTSLQELNRQKAQIDDMLSKINTLKSQLKTLKIDPTNLKTPVSEYILYAHSDGIVSEILQPLHSVITQQTKIINIAKEQSFYLKSFVPLKYAPVIKKAKKALLHYIDKDIPTQIEQILPNVDEKTQRIVLLSSIQEKIDDLFVGAYVPATIYLTPNREYLGVKSSALSFFNNEWVVFVPRNNHEEQNDHSEHEKHDHDEHKHENEESDHDEHEEEIGYEPKVVKILESDGKFVAIEGLSEGEKYVSDKAYFVKSMLLKSSLGGHGH